MERIKMAVNTPYHSHWLKRLQDKLDKAGVKYSIEQDLLNIVFPKESLIAGQAILDDMREEQMHEDVKDREHLNIATGSLEEAAIPLWEALRKRHEVNGCDATVCIVTYNGGLQVYYPTAASWPKEFFEQGNAYRQKADRHQKEMNQMDDEIQKKIAASKGFNISAPRHDFCIGAFIFSSMLSMLHQASQQKVKFRAVVEYSPENDRIYFIGEDVSQLRHAECPVLVMDPPDSTSKK